MRFAKPSIFPELPYTATLALVKRQSKNPTFDGRFCTFVGLYPLMQGKKQRNPVLCQCCFRSHAEHYKERTWECPYHIFCKRRVARWRVHQTYPITQD